MSARSICGCERRSGRQDEGGKMPSSISGRGRLKLRSAKKRDMVTANGVSVLQKETCHGDRRGGRSGEWQDWCAARHRPTLPPFGARGLHGSRGRGPRERGLRCYWGPAAYCTFHARPGQSGTRSAPRQCSPGAEHTGCSASVACHQRLEAYTTSSRRWANNPVCEADSMSALSST